jgi:hypothetical protein
MHKAGRHCEAAQPTKQSMFIIALRSSGLLRCTRNDDEFVIIIIAIAQALILKERFLLDALYE